MNIVKYYNTKHETTVVQDSDYCVVKKELSYEELVDYLKNIAFASEEHRQAYINSFNNK